MWLGVAALLVPLLVLITLGPDGKPNALEFRYFAFALFIVMVGIAWTVWKKGEMYKPPSNERLCLFSFRAFKHLSNYGANELASEREKASKNLKYLISLLNSKWEVSEKFAKGLLDDFDILVNPIVRLILILEKSYAPVIEEGTKDEIIKITGVFADLAVFFNNPTKGQLDSILDMTNPTPRIPNESSKKSSFFAERPLLKHGLILASVSAIAGIITYYFTSAYSANDLHWPIEMGLIVGIGVAGVYGAFLAVFLKRN